MKRGFFFDPSLPGVVMLVGLSVKRTRHQWTPARGLLFDPSLWCYYFGAWPRTGQVLLHASSNEAVLSVKPCLGHYVPFGRGLQQPKLVFHFDWVTSKRH